MKESAENDFPLADDDSIPNELDKTSKQITLAQPLPREEIEDLEEKARLISQILELQNTLEDLSQRFENVKDECSKLHSENRVLNQYIKNLMSSSTLFHPANSNSTLSKHAADMFDDHCW